PVSRLGIGDEPHVVLSLDPLDERDPQRVVQRPTVREDKGDREDRLAGLRRRILPDGDLLAVGTVDDQVRPAVDDLADGHGCCSSWTTTGAWSLAPFPLRSSRSMAAP